MTTRELIQLDHPDLPIKAPPSWSEIVSRWHKEARDLNEGSGRPHSSARGDE